MCISGGAEFVVHLVRSVVNDLGDSSAYALRTFEYRNAFNKVSRQRIMEVVARDFPELLPYVEMCYSKASHLWWQGHRISSAWGVQQGDPIGPLLYCVVVHPILCAVARQIVAEFPDLDKADVFKLFVCYLDDGYIVACHDALLRVGELLAEHDIELASLPTADGQNIPGQVCTVPVSDQEVGTQVVVKNLRCIVPRHLYNLAFESGGHLNVAKSPAWWPTRPSEEVLARYEASGVKFTEGDGTLVLKVPVGFDTYATSQVMSRIEDLQPRMATLANFVDTQTALLILRVCMGTCRVNYLLRALPQPLVAAASRSFDVMMRETFSRLSCEVVTDDIWCSPQLPIAMTSAPGLGLTSAESTASAAHLSLLNGSREVMSKLLPADLLHRFVFDPRIRATYDDLVSRTSSAPPFTALTSEERYTQKALVTCVHNKLAADILLRRPPAEKARVRALTLTGAKA